MKKFQTTLPLFMLSLLVACAPASPGKSRIQLDKEGAATLLVLGVENTDDLKERAQRLGVQIEGDSVLRISGDAAQIAQLELVSNNSFAYLEDHPIKVEKTQSFTPSSMPLYLAKKEFGLLEFWKKRPQADGRGVKVGVIDDGISPHQLGFQTTSTGRRKFLKKASNSSFSTFELIESDEGYIAQVDEARPSLYGKVDLNGDGKHDAWKVRVDKNLTRACVDLNRNGTIEEDECAGSFSQSGEYLLIKDQRLAMMFEIDPEKKTLQIFQPESGSDSHGEGVASVLAGHRIGGLEGFDGVAPGAQILDYDLSEYSDRPEENEFTLSTFLLALDWLGSEGAQVANVSYSLFFSSAQSQDFMSKALDEIVKKHNMVVSFSAGNNGPGLGSLNRAGIYPSSVLVAGAYVSKELDEVVHGVTGLPEEGRVIYYSSRGPGLGGGPTLISPLSSLTNSTPDTGHRAFSGTSSASPALAGAAATLVSAIQQEGLEVDAVAVVHALRLSGKRLKAEPFIFQGYGLPQVEKALAIYKDLALGKNHMNVQVSVSEEGLDGVPAKGIFLRSSEHGAIVSRDISLRGEISKLAPASAHVNLLTPVRLQYSKGLSGPSNLWISRSASSFGVDIDLEAALDGELEGFGEIKIYSSLDDSLMAVVPVTVVRDQNILDAPSAIFELGAQEGKRLPLYAPAGVVGFKLKATVLEGNAKSLVVAVYDQNQIRLFQRRVSSEIWTGISGPGLWQAAAFMTKGTARKLKVELSVDPIEVRLITRSVLKSNPVVKVQNLGNSALNGKLRLTPQGTPVESVYLGRENIEEGAVIKTSLSKGQYLLNFAPMQRAQLEYFYSSCSVKTTDAEGKTELQSTKSFFLEEDSTEVEIRCMPFDKGGKLSGDLGWRLSLEKQGEKVSERIDLAAGQTRSANFGEHAEKLQSGDYTVELVDPFTGNAIRLGEVELF